MLIRNSWIRAFVTLRHLWTATLEHVLSSNFVDSIKRFQVLEPDVNSQSLFLSNRQKLYIYGYVVCRNNHLTTWHQMIEIYKCLNYQGFKSYILSHYHDVHKRMSCKHGIHKLKLKTIHKYFFLPL